jgi:hypothetical protein
MWFGFREKQGDSRHSAALGDFSDFIFELGHLDILLVGRHFTWSNNWEMEVWSRIDKFLPSPEWEKHFPDVSQQ